MPSDELVTRGALARRLAVNAATKPLNVAVLGGLIVVGHRPGPRRRGRRHRDRRLPRARRADLLRRPGGRASGRPALRRPAPGRARAPALDVGTLEPRIAALVQRARETAAGIRDAIAQADHPFDDVAADVDALVAAMDTSARRAQLISSTLADQARAGQDVAGLEGTIADLRSAPRRCRRARAHRRPRGPARRDRAPARAPGPLRGGHAAHLRVAGPAAHAPRRDVGLRGGGRPARAGAPVARAAPAHRPAGRGDGRGLRRRRRRRSSSCPSPNTARSAERAAPI